MKVLTGMTGARKAAILALSLGEEGAREMMTCLDDADVERLAREVATLDTVEPEDREQVLTEFHRKMEEGVVEKGGSEAVRRLLDQSLAPGAAKEMYERVTKSVKTTAGFTSLTQSDPNQLAKFVLNEQPQTIALIMAHLDGSAAAELVRLLPEQLRTDVIARMASLDETSPEVAFQISSVIEQRLRAVSGTSHEAHGGVRAVAELLNRLERSVGNSVLEAVEEQTPDLAVSIRNLMFVFDDLVNVEDNAFRELVQRSDRKTLTVALKGASEAIRNRFFKNMSTRAVGVLKEEMDLLGAVRLREVEAAQQEIVGVARQLEEEGILTTGAAAGEAYVV
jgi:flagellar motor switch protein FliG